MEKGGFSQEYREAVGERIEVAEIPHFENSWRRQQGKHVLSEKRVEKLKNEYIYYHVALNITILL